MDTGSTLGSVMMVESHCRVYAACESVDYIVENFEKMKNRISKSGADLCEFCPILFH